VTDRRILILPSKIRELRCADQEVQRFANEDVGRAFTQTFDSFQALLRDPQFIAPTLLNSWVNFGSTHANAGYYKDPFGRVHLRGMVKSGTTVANTPIFTLPVGYRPTADLLFPVDSNGAHGTSCVRSSGNVTFEAGSATYFALNGISFAAV
jgi:hypothetical protein